MQIRRFEELGVWQKARDLSLAIYQITDQGAFRRDFGLRDQIRRAAVSVMSNIAEGSNATAGASSGNSSQSPVGPPPRFGVSSTLRVGSTTWVNRSSMNCMRFVLK